MHEVEGQASGHGGVALAANPGACGDGFAEGQAEVVQGEFECGGLAFGGQRLVMVAGDAVVAAWRDGHALAVGVAGELHEAHVEVAAGMEGDGGVVGL